MRRVAGAVLALLGLTQFLLLATGIGPVELRYVPQRAYMALRFATSCAYVLVGAYLLDRFRAT